MSTAIHYAALRERSALKYMLPWLQEHHRATLDALGEGYWDYGIEKNRHVWPPSPATPTSRDWRRSSGPRKTRSSPGSTKPLSSDD